MEKFIEKDMKQLLFGAAYYDEYMPYERLDKDVEMMKKAGINSATLGVFSWSVYEPSEGEYNFVLKNGTKTLIKRRLFEKYLESVDAI